MESLTGKKALITGATSGIGLAIATALLSEDVFVYFVGRDFSEAKKMITKSKVHSNTYRFIETDFAKCDDFIDTILKALDKEIDILIHSAGVISIGEFHQTKVEDLDYQYKVNLRAPFVLTKALLDQLKRSEGDIVFINSTAGIDSWEGISQYAASKHALRAMTDSLRKEVSKEKIRIASLYLGSVDTPMQRTIHQQKGKINYDSSKFMQPEDIAEAVVTVLKMAKRATITDLTIRQNF